MQESDEDDEDDDEDNHGQHRDFVSNFNDSLTRGQLIERYAKMELARRVFIAEHYRALRPELFVLNEVRRWMRYMVMLI